MSLLDYVMNKPKKEEEPRNEVQIWKGKPGSYEYILTDSMEYTPYYIRHLNDRLNQIEELLYGQTNSQQ